MSSTVRALLIEDDDAKGQTVYGSLNREFSRLKILGDVTFAGSVQSAIEWLKRDSFDLIVADMSLPTFDVKNAESGGSPRPLGGLEVFDFLERLGLKVPVIVITSYPVISDGSTHMKFSELEATLSLDFPDIFIGSIYYDSTFTNWDEKLGHMLNNIFKA